MRKILSVFAKKYVIKNQLSNTEFMYNFKKSIFKDFNTIPQINLWYFRLGYNKACFYSKLYLNCFLTGRTRAVLKNFMLSRMMFKKIGLDGYIAGVKKASW